MAFMLGVKSGLPVVGVGPARASVRPLTLGSSAKVQSETLDLASPKHRFTTETYTKPNKTLRNGGTLHNSVALPAI